MITIKTHSPEETRALGALMARDLKTGDLVAFRGDLGAGKSELARAILRAKGVEGPIPSPTFTLLQVYEAGGEQLYHFDWYRLSGADEVEEAGLMDMLPGNGIALVEWPQQAEEALTPCRLEVEITLGEDDLVRQITLTPMGGFHALPALEQYNHRLEET